MSARLADLIYRFRLPLCAVIAIGFLGLLPLTNVTAIDNDISMWISRDDPIYRTYERFRQEFGGQSEQENVIVDEKDGGCHNALPLLPIRRGHMHPSAARAWAPPLRAIPSI